MNRTATQYAAADHALTVLLAGVPAAAWSAPSPCEGWSAADVVGHLITTQREFLGTHGVDLGAAPDLAPDPAAAWRAHAAAVAAALTDDAVPDREFEGFFGPTTVGATFLQFYVWDMLVHRWDIARAAGVDAGLTADELDRIEEGAESFGPALYTDGVCGAAVDAPETAPRETRVLARLGRVA
ncbi:TIGR03086 family metal-binding protein [Blastococcus haudaquaticus]|uniref:TIGR03086 family protein n=1 Tax=Blastococcus haudaquaticus TaxID=1938745 RepID=A0A286H5Y2_9ACTN|nr:TIGR03086 family metal-binding protein [Blastococcus haudaquaticus]SOE02739.1 TIGR03086 family protein [Blastococcus haudaquaticus]